MHAYIHNTYVHTYVHIYVHTYIHTHTHTGTHTNTHTGKHACMHVYNVTVSSIKLIGLQAVRQKPNSDSTSFEIWTRQLSSKRLAPRNSRFIYKLIWTSRTYAIKGKTIPAHVMTYYGKARMELHSFLAVVLGADEWSVSNPVRFNCIGIKQKAVWPPEQVWTLLRRNICHPFCK